MQFLKLFFSIRRSIVEWKKESLNIDKLFPPFLNFWHFLSSLCRCSISGKKSSWKIIIAWFIEYSSSSSFMPILSEKKKEKFSKFIFLFLIYLSITILSSYDEIHKTFYSSLQNISKYACMILLALTYYYYHCYNIFTDIITTCICVMMKLSTFHIQTHT